MKIAYYLAAMAMFVVFSTGISGCDESKDIQNWVDNTAKLRGSAEDQLPNTPYRRPQHEAFKTYFSELNQMALALKNDEKLRSRFNEAAAQGDLNVVCRKALMSRVRWTALMQNCTKNRFFLCAEEVRAFPQLVRGLRAVLRTDLQRKFDQAQACQNAL